MWAVLAGEESLVRTLWARTADTLRAAMMASQLSRKLSALPHLRADQAALRRQSDSLEDLALSLLDAISDSARAMPLIAMVPCVGKGDAAQPLWSRSVLDLAAGDDDVAACKRLVAHRHSQHLLEAFFSGDFPLSRARIPTDSSVIQIAVQAPHALRSPRTTHHAAPSFSHARNACNVCNASPSSMPRATRQPPWRPVTPPLATPPRTFRYALHALHVRRSSSSCRAPSAR